MADQLPQVVPRQIPQDSVQVLVTSRHRVDLVLLHFLAKIQGRAVQSIIMGDRVVFFVAHTVA